MQEPEARLPVLVISYHHLDGVQHTGLSLSTTGHHGAKHSNVSDPGCPNAGPLHALQSPGMCAR